MMNNNSGGPTTPEPNLCNRVDQLETAVAGLRGEHDDLVSGLDSVERELRSLALRLDAAQASGSQRSQDVAADPPSVRRNEGPIHIGLASDYHGASESPYAVLEDTLTLDAALEVDASTPAGELIGEQELFGNLHSGTTHVDFDLVSDPAAEDNDDHIETVTNFQDRGERPAEPGSESNQPDPAEFRQSVLMDVEPRRMFVALAHSHIGDEFEIDKSVMTIGRGRSSDIRIQHLAVSRRHARLRELAGGLVIEDIGSRNGIAVNSRVVERAVLRDGDVINFGGEVDFRYVEVETPPH